MQNGHVRNMEELDREISRIKLEMNNIESKVDANFASLRQNYGSMAMNSIFGEKETRKVSQVMGMVASGFVNNPKLQEGIGTAVESISERIGDWVIGIANRLRKKKE